jgi:hypothetical protein
MSRSTISVPKETHATASWIADADGVTLTAYVRDLIEADYLARLRSEATRLDTLAVESGFAAAWEHDCDVLDARQ